MFGIILTSDNILSTGQPYTFTYSYGSRLFEYRSQEWVQGQLSSLLSDLGSVYSVERPLFSDHYIITVIPIMDESLEAWTSLIDWAFVQMGYGSAIFIRAEGGVASTQPGGLSQIIPQIGDITASTLKPLLPYALILLAIMVLPSLTRGYYAGSN